MTVPRFPRPLRGVLFDLDGTLVDTEPLHVETAAQVLAEEGVALTQAEYHALAGLADVTFFARVKERYPIAASAEALTDRRTEVLLQRIRGMTLLPKAGVHALLDLLAARGVAAAVASGSVRPMIDALLVAAGLDQRLPVRRSGHDDVAQPKPAPDVFVAAARAIAAAPEECIAVEDSRAGVASARGAGCFVVFVPSPSFPVAPPAGVDLVLESLELLVPIVEGHLRR